MRKPLTDVGRTYRLIFLSVLLGVAAAAAAEAFLVLVSLAQKLLITGVGGFTPLSVAAVAAGQDRIGLSDTWYWQIPLATTLGGLLSGWLVYRFAPETEGHGTDAVVEAYHRQDGVIRARVPLVKMLASAITLGAGGAAGREGPIAQTGAGIGSLIARGFGLSTGDRRILLLVGMAAGLAAIFKSPLGASLFAIKVLYSRLAMETEDLGYCVLGAISAYAVVGWFDDWQPLFILPDKLSLSGPLELLWYLPLGIAAGVMGAWLPTLFYRVRDVFRRLPVPQLLKPAIGGLVLGLIGMGLPEALGGGYGSIQAAIDGRFGLSVLLLLLVTKPLALALTVGSGGSGGVFAPSLSIGALLGALFALLIEPANPVHIAALPVVGMVAVFAGAARAPLAALVMVTEMTGGYQLIAPSMIAVALGMLVQMVLTSRVRYPTLYEAQVPSPADSPTHQQEHCSAMYQLVRQGRAHLDPQLVEQDVTARLLSGEPVPLPEDSGLLMLLPVAAGSAVTRGPLSAGVLLPSTVQAIGVLRGSQRLVATPDVQLREADRLMVVVADPAEIEQLRQAVQSRDTR